MGLLIDTDAFVKLAVGKVLEDAIRGLGLAPADCYRLAALPYMLRGGRLARRLGEDRCEQLLLETASFPAAPEPPEAALGEFAAIDAIDAGEAQLLALVAERDDLLLTGDKRALRAVAAGGTRLQELARKVVTVEAALIRLCDHLGEDRVRQSMRAARELDTMLTVCFSDGADSPRRSLMSYFNSDIKELSPLELWHPEKETRGEDDAESWDPTG